MSKDRNGPYSERGESDQERLGGTLFKDRQQGPRRLEALDDKVFVNRDSKEEYIVKYLDEHKNKITLLSMDRKKTVTLNLAEFKEKLRTMNSAWMMKEEDGLP